jgi:hypothetical protein
MWQKRTGTMHAQPQLELFCGVLAASKSIKSRTTSPAVGLHQRHRRKNE